MKKNTVIISGFPGIGKSTLYLELHRLGNRVVLDSDSSKFSWSEPGIRHPDFPRNYIDHIQSYIGSADYIFVSSHKVVRDALAEAGIDYILVYPHPSLKQQYIERYKARGNEESFISFIDDNWDDFIADMRSETHPSYHYQIGENMYLSDILYIFEKDHLSHGSL